EIRDLTMKELENYDIGLMLTDVKIQDAEMPTDEVNEAYKAVLSALQGKEATINLAQAYKESKIPEMEAEVKSITLNAEYDKQKRINEAKMQIAMFEAMYEQYKLNPDATRMRMYHEALQEFLPGTRVYIDTSKDGSLEKLLPVESFYTEEEKK
ncbi:MAG: FtsH protease activity modulator HflK, partial [Clostridia bacterium]|nr:FtsH protease activity modulator HflK [Clostridia bacterium]